MPTTTKDTPVVEDNRDGTVCVKYDPREQGTHELFIKHNEADVPGIVNFFIMFLLVIWILNIYFLLNIIIFNCLVCTLSTIVDNYVKYQIDQRHFYFDNKIKF